MESTEIFSESLAESSFSKPQTDYGSSDLRINDIICNTFNDGFRRIGWII
jgi:hypothetical protein